MENYVEKIVRQFGNASILARELGHKHPTKIYYWIKVGRIPQWRQRQIMEAAKQCGFKLYNNDFFVATTQQPKDAE